MYLPELPKRYDYKQVEQERLNKLKSLREEFENFNAKFKFQHSPDYENFLRLNEEMHSLEKGLYSERTPPEQKEEIKKLLKDNEAKIHALFDSAGVRDLRERSEDILYRLPLTKRRIRDIFRTDKQYERGMKYYQREIRFCENKEGYHAQRRERIEAGAKYRVEREEFMQKDLEKFQKDTAKEFSLLLQMPGEDIMKILVEEGIMGLVKRFPDKAEAILEELERPMKKMQERLAEKKGARAP